ncbi:Vigilin [Trichinella spiralis]|uniref:Vigilin n=1 Tax=Trichinella spiralis TaxID=6334 RepID=A0A0V1BFM2_TRISP|nr:Vigilin [Trichinella spiralis]
MAVVFFTVLLIPRCHSKQRRLSQLVVFDFVFSVGWLMNPDISMMYSSPSLNMVSTDSLTLNGSPMLGNTMDSLHVVTSCLGPVAQSAPAFPVAPGAEHSAQKQQQQQQQQQQQHHQQQQNQQPFIGSGTVEQNRKIVMDYEADFPKLATSTNAPGTTLSALATTPAIRSTTVTQIFQLPYEERKFRVKQDNQYGSNERNSEQIECNDIMQKTATSIELCHNKDQSITIVVSGKRQAVEEARKLIVQQLQTQANRELRIPKQYHRMLIGKEGRRLHLLEKETDCRIVVPHRNNSSDVIKVIGPREGIEKAIHKIQIFVDEQSKLASENLIIPKIYYPWIRGPDNAVVDRIKQETGVSVHIPPPSANNEVIVVTGEKEGVYKAVAQIREIYEEKQRTCRTVTVSVAPSQHSYVMGYQRSGITEILRDTGVSVEFSADEESPEITLRGHPDQLGYAVAMVYAKASSIITARVNCPTWLHKFIIGSKGANLKAIVGDFSKVHVTFESEGFIFLEGPPQDVERVTELLKDRVAALENEMATDVVIVHPSLHGHIIGKNGLNIVRIRQEFEVNVIIPDPGSHSSEVRLEGKKAGVVKAKEEIQLLAEKKENEKIRDILIDSRFHKMMIGVKGEHVRDLRQRFPNVVVNFPDQGRKSDVVSLRGPKNEVDACYGVLQQMYRELLESKHQVRVPIFKDFLKHIIGKGGSNIKKLMEETGTKIEIPSDENSNESNVILITGKKSDTAKAEKLLQKMQSELANIVTLELNIPRKLHSSLIGSGGRLIHSIGEECGGVQIKFPAENAHSDTVTVRGPKDGVDKARKVLLDLVKDREASSFTAEVKARPELFGFLIGSGGSRVKKMRESFPSVRILFPRPCDDDKETIHLIGKKNDVLNAKKQLDDWISELNRSVEIAVNIDPKWHSHFLARSRSVLRDIQEQFGGIFISFPKLASGNGRVTLKGPKECVEGAKVQLLDIVAKLESQVTEGVHIHPRHYKMLLRNRGAFVQDISHQYDVQIKFPDREQQQQQKQQQQKQQANSNNHATTNSSTANWNGTCDGNGNSDGENARASSPAVVDQPLNDLVLVTGQPDNCKKVIQLLLAEIPITEVIHVPVEFHRNLIGRQGSEIRRLMEAFTVNVHIAPPDQSLDDVVISGKATAVNQAIEAIKQHVIQLEREVKDRELKSFALQLPIPCALVPKLIGIKGREIQRLRSKYDVMISVPQQRGDDGDTEITITGYEENATNCKKEIETMVADYKSLCTQEIALDCRVHNRIIGQRGKNVKRIMEQYQVEIRFPRQADQNPNLVTVCGKVEDSVFDCIDHLRNLEEEYLQDIVDRYAYRDPMRMAEENTTAQHQPAMEIVNAPWQKTQTDDELSKPVPDMENMQEFPSMVSDLPQSQVNASVWNFKR